MKETYAIDVMDQCNRLCPAKQTVYLGEKDDNGQPFFTLTSGGDKKEHERFPALFSTVESSKRAFVAEFRVLAVGKTGTHWRWIPEVIAIACGDEGTRYTILARLSFE